MKNDNDEDFQTFESKINEVVKILNLMNNHDSQQQGNAIKLADDYLKRSGHVQEAVSQDDFIVKFVQDRTVINRSAKASDEAETNSGISVTAFQQDVERDATRRAQERRDRENVAQNLRRAGNQAYRNGKFEEAVNLYTKGIDHVHTSPVLYNNRAMTYIRLGLFKKAIIDADLVLQKLDEKNLRAWMLRGKAYHSLGEMRDYQKCVNEAKKGNPKKIDLIESMVAKIEAEGDHDDEFWGQSNWPYWLRRIMHEKRAHF